MKFNSKLGKLAFLACALFFFYSSVQAQKNGCEQTITFNSITTTVNLITGSGPGDFDLSVDFQGLDCALPANSECVCECFLAIYFNPLEEPWASNYPYGLNVVDLALEGPGQTLYNIPDLASLGYFPDGNAIVISTGVLSGASEGRLYIEFDQDPPSSLSVDSVTGLCVIDNIDRPGKPPIHDVVISHLGLGEPIGPR